MSLRLGKLSLFLGGLAGYAAGVVVDQLIQRWERRTGRYTVPR